MTSCIFGHTLHVMLNKSEFQHTAGFRGPTDFTEFPSSVIERYAYQGKVVQLFAKSSSGASMPLSLHKQACDANSQFTGLDYLRKIYMNVLDQRMHAGGGENVRELAKRTFSEYMLLSPSPSGFFECPATIRHFGSYGSFYYSYLYTDMLSSVTWEKMFSKDPLSRETGTRFTQKILVPAIRRDQASVIADLLGSFPSPSDVQQIGRR